MLNLILLGPAIEISAKSTIILFLIIEDAIHDAAVILESALYRSKLKACALRRYEVGPPVRVSYVVLLLLAV